MMDNKVSLILTTYNCKDNLMKTLGSIDLQDYPNIEIIIKDGISSDGTLDLIKEYAHTTKKHVKWDSSEDSGIYDAMNQGYRLATGDYVLFFNDTFIRKDAISLMVAAIEESSKAIGCHSDLTYSNNGKIIRSWKMGNQKSVYTGWMPGHPTLLLKREIYEKYGLYRTDMHIAADYEFMVRFLKEKKNKLAYVPEVLIDMFYGGTSSSGLSTYWQSLQEGHRALKINGYRFAVIADINRCIRFATQFVNHPV